MAEINTGGNKLTYKTYFLYSKDETGEKIGICNLCRDKKVEKNVKMKNGNTSGLKKHLNIYHPQEYKLLFGHITAKKQVTKQNTLEVFVSFL